MDSTLPDPNTMTVEQLKAELSLHDLEITGRKAALIARVIHLRQQSIAECEEAEEQTEEDPLIECDEAEKQTEEDPLIECEEADKQTEEDPLIECEEAEKQIEEDPLIDIVDHNFLMTKISFGALSSVVKSNLKSKRVMAYPVSAPELAGEFLSNYVKKCCYYSLKFTPTSIRKDCLGYLSLKFTKDEDYEGATEALQEWKPDIKVESTSLEEADQGVLIKNLGDDSSKLFHPGNRFVCVVGTPPTITETRLLEILPGHSATVCTDKTGEHSGICFVEFESGELAEEAVELAQAELTHDGHKLYAFQLNHTPLASPDFGGVMSKKEIMNKLAASKSLRMKLMDNWATNITQVTTETLRSNIDDIEASEKEVTDDAELRIKYHLPHADIWMTYLTYVMGKDINKQPLGVRPLGTLAVSELKLRLIKREANKATRQTRKAHRKKAIASNAFNQDNSEKVTPQPNIKKTETKSFQKRSAGIEHGPVNKRQRGSFSPGRGGLGRGPGRGGFGGRGGARSYNSEHYALATRQHPGYGVVRQGGYGGDDNNSGGYSNSVGYGRFRNQGNMGYNGRNKGPNDLKERAVDILQQLTDVLSADAGPRNQGNHGSWNRQQNFQGGGYY